MTGSHTRLVVVAALGSSQTLAWASSYYLPAILASPISAAIGLSPSWVFAAFSSSLLIAAIVGPRIGRMIDRYGGRGVLVLSNVVLAAGLVALTSASGPVSLFSAWAILGVGMALGLYDAAFATLTALYGADARGPITGITLFAGFASTLSWPLSSLLDDLAGWRGTCLMWAALNLCLGLPLNSFCCPRLRARRAEIIQRWSLSAGNREGRCSLSLLCLRPLGSSPDQWRPTCRDYWNWPEQHRSQP
jgi:MFS family permease